MAHTGPRQDIWAHSGLDEHHAVVQEAHDDYVSGRCPYKQYREALSLATSPARNGGPQGRRHRVQTMAPGDQKPGPEPGLQPEPGLGPDPEPEPEPELEPEPAVVAEAARCKVSERQQTNSYKEVLTAYNSRPEPKYHSDHSLDIMLWSNRHKRALAKTQSANQQPEPAATMLVPHTDALLFLSEALFDYKPPLLMEEHEHDLQFAKGDVIEVLIETVEEMGEGWSLGRVGGRVGFFPANYTRRVEYKLNTQRPGGRPGLHRHRHSSRTLGDMDTSDR